MTGPHTQPNPRSKTGIWDTNISISGLAHPRLPRGWGEDEGPLHHLHQSHVQCLSPTSCLCVTKGTWGLLISGLFSTETVLVPLISIKLQKAGVNSISQHPLFLNLL